MLDPLETEFLDSVQRRGTAYQGVRIRNAAGRDFYYVFILERQKIGDIKDCWMTAGVRTLHGCPDFPGGIPGGGEQCLAVPPFPLGGCGLKLQRRIC